MVLNKYSFLRITALTFIISGLFFNFSYAQKYKKEVLQNLDNKQSSYGETAHQIWQWAELGYQETKSSALLQELLEKEGFTIETGVAGIPTAFVATYGSGSPVIGVLAEYDALPGLSQAAVTKRQPVIDEAPGHACGHHLFGTATVAAAIEVKNWLVKSGHAGTIRLYGTPAEEGGAGRSGGHHDSGHSARAQAAMGGAAEASLHLPN